MAAALETPDAVDFLASLNLDSPAPVEADEPVVEAVASQPAEPNVDLEPFEIETPDAVDFLASLERAEAPAADVPAQAEVLAEPPGVAEPAVDASLDVLSSPDLPSPLAEPEAVAIEAAAPVDAELSFDFLGDAEVSVDTPEAADTSVEEEPAAPVEFEATAMFQAESTAAELPHVDGSTAAEEPTWDMAAELDSVEPQASEQVEPSVPMASPEPVAKKPFWPVMAKSEPEPVVEVKKPFWPVTAASLPATPAPAATASPPMEVDPSGTFAHAAATPIEFPELAANEGVEAVAEEPLEFGFAVSESASPQAPPSSTAKPKKASQPGLIARILSLFKKKPKAKSAAGTVASVAAVSAAAEWVSAPAEVDLPSEPPAFAPACDAAATDAPPSDAWSPSLDEPVAAESFSLDEEPAAEGATLFEPDMTGEPTGLVEMPNFADARADALPSETPADADEEGTMLFEPTALASEPQFESDEGAEVQLDFMTIEAAESTPPAAVSEPDDALMFDFLASAAEPAPASASGDAEAAETPAADDDDLNDFFKSLGVK